MAPLFRSGRRADVPITDANYPEGLFRDFFDIVAPKEGTWSHFGKSHTRSVDRANIRAADGGRI